MAQSGKAFYTGLFRHTLDDKFRLTIPSAWRYAHEGDDTFLATPHPDGYVAVLPPAEVEKLHAKIAQVALSDGAGQDFAARFFAQTQTFSFDKSGRVGLEDASGLDRVELLPDGVGPQGSEGVIGVGAEHDDEVAVEQVELLEADLHEGPPIGVRHLRCRPGST